MQSEVVEGDTLKVLFQRKYADDQPAGYGDVLCAIYDGTKTGRKMAVRFDREDGKHYYYDKDGVSVKKSFLKLPLSVCRVTSGYGMRFHPISMHMAMHKGVDYGAPIGTPVKAIADGVVTYAGWMTGYGNLICIRHCSGYESKYGHLSKINVRVGQKIKQSQFIGLVGATGYVTGPHLHFEFLEKGIAKDPAKGMATMVTPVPRVPDPLMTRFDEVRQGAEQDRDNLMITNKNTGIGRSACLMP